MVESQVVSITAANHADEHRHGGDDPITGDVRIDNLPKYSGVEIFNGNAPTVYTDLDISAIVGANRCMCVILVRNGVGGGNVIATRPDGSAFDMIAGSASRNHSGNVYLDASHDGYITVITDAAGVFEWIAENARATILNLYSYSTLG